MHACRILGLVDYGVNLIFSRIHFLTPPKLLLSLMDGQNADNHVQILHAAAWEVTREHSLVHSLAA